MTSQTALDQARSELAAVETELEALAAAKSGASRTTASFTKWKTDRDTKTAERERLIAWIEALESEVAVIESEEAEAAFRKRYEARVAANAKLAERIPDYIKKANSILLALVREVAEAAADDAQINAALPDDLEPLTPADFIARGRRPIPRLDIGTTRVWL
jgi:hypothetical protein